MKREYILILLVILYSLSVKEYSSIAGRIAVDSEQEVVKQSVQSSLHNARFTVPACELLTSSGIDLHSPLKAPVALVREWDLFAVRDAITFLSDAQYSRQVYLPFDRPDIIFPFHFFK